MKISKKSTGLACLSMFFIAGAVQAYTLVPNALDTVSAGWLVTGFTGFAQNLLADPIQIIDLQRAAVPIPGAIWLLVSGLGFLGWFRRNVVVN